MSIQSFIEKVCVETAVYWEPTGFDGKGGRTYETPVEIKVRWENKTKLIVNRTGKQVVSEASVLVTADVLKGGSLFLGSLTDLSSDPSNPLEEDDTFEIIGFDKIPMIKSTTIFVRTAYLKVREI